jgi:hypothetical protein
MIEECEVADVKKKLNVYVMWFTQKNNIVRGLVGGDNNIFVMEERQVFSNIWVFKDWWLYCWVCQMLHETSFQIINKYRYSIGGQNRASELLWH